MMSCGSPYIRHPPETKYSRKGRPKIALSQEMSYTKSKPIPGGFSMKQGRKQIRRPAGTPIAGLFTAAVLLTAVLLPAAGQTKFGLGESQAPPILDKSLDGATASPQAGGLPSSVDLTSLFPEPGYQDRLNSCVGWATAYAAKTYQENAERRWGDPLSEAEIFSPSYIYNQINGGRDRGATIIAAMDLVVNQGAATLKTMPYTLNHRQQPPAAARKEAARYPAQTFERLTPSNHRAVKTQLSQGHPVIFGMIIHRNFMDYRSGVYDTTRGPRMGGHAMTLIGYDDQKQAYKLINSWSDQWGLDGYAWVSYQVFADTVHSAYVLKDKVAATPSRALPPNGVSASAAASETLIRITWKPVKNARGYRVFRAAEPAGDYRRIAEVRGTTYLDRRLSPDSTFYYSIRTLAEGDPSELSAIAQGSTKASPRELGIPQGLEGYHEEGTVTLMWDPVDGAEAYHIYRMDMDRENFVRIGRSKDRGYRYSVERAPTRTERYMVTAAAGEREGKGCTSIGVLIEEEEPDFLTPPQGLTASRGDHRNKIVLSWQPVSGASAYAVLRWDSFARDWEILETAVEDTRYTDSRLGFDKKAHYTVVARRDSLLSEAAEFTRGWVRSYRPPQEKPVAGDDRDYYGRYNRDIRESAESSRFFDDDDFFTDPEEFFGDFKEEEFFFLDEEAFFAVDEEEFFGNNEGFFD